MANERLTTPTCEYGFWKPMHEGCPKCGPNGPCTDPEYEALIQKEARSIWRKLWDWLT